MKSWVAQGKSGRRVTLLPGTTFLHINGALVPDYMSRAGPVSRASPVFRDLGTPVKRNKKQLSDYMTMQQKATFR